MTVLSILTYASDICVFYTVRDLETLHMKYLKQKLGVQKIQAVIWNLVDMEYFCSSLLIK